MPSRLDKKHSNALLLALFNSLADFDGQIFEEATAILNELKQRSDPIPPLYADVLGLPFSTTCMELAQRIASLSQQQLAIASYAFQIFRSYEHLLKADTVAMAPEQRSAYEAQLERVRLLVARTKTAIDEVIKTNYTPDNNS